ncbi:MAG: glutamate--cysteine ligase [Planctomycetes bacterium]|nr:glutamate--cysteine ligase [Planctomycetota bacterium]
MTLHLFEAFGIELEYMIVDRATLAARPIADELIRAASGDYVEFERGGAAWSNELVLHVVEFKTNGPAPALEPLPALFQGEVREANRLLEPLGACLLPTGMHPFFDPLAETRLWPHDYNVVYETYNRIFDCRGHGWSNLQSAHLNLPFADDLEFARLHAVVRLLLPLLPGLAASTPVADGRLAPALDFRLVAYANNSARIPQATGLVVPEPVYSREAYYRDVLQPIWTATAPFDPEGNLAGEYANARGAIARFDRMAIEIRVLDLQECPLADVAVHAAIVGALQALLAQHAGDPQRLEAWPTESLAALFHEVCVAGETHVVRDRAYLDALGVAAAEATVGEIWATLIERGLPDGGAARATFGPTLAHVQRKGTLATRIRRAAGAAPTRARLAAIYRELARCLATGELFDDAAL